MHQISQFTIIDAMMYTGKLGWCTFERSVLSSYQQIHKDTISPNTQGTFSLTNVFATNWRAGWKLCINKLKCKKTWSIFNLKFALTTKTNSCDHGWIVSECRCIIYISLPPFQLWRPCCCGTLHVSGSPDHRGVAQLLFRPREGEIGRRAVQIQLG